MSEGNEIGIAGLDSLGMPELRAIATDLEHLLERDLKANKKKDLLALIGDALAELPPEALSSLLETHNVKDPEIDAETGSEELKPGEGPIAVEAESQEGAESLSEVKIDTSEIPKGVKFELIVEPSTPALKELPHAIQVREYPTSSNYNYGDVVVNPSRELCESLTHAALSAEGLKRMIASGRAGRIHKL